MGLREELKMSSPMNKNRETILSLIKTSSMLTRLSDRFFSQFGTSDIQFNILMILNCSAEQGLSQQELSERLVVTKSNVVGLIDRMEKQGLVQRKSHPTDRRFNQIVITLKGQKLVEKVEGYYYEEVNRMTASLSEQEKKSIVDATEKIREYLRDNWEGNHASKKSR